MKSKLSRAETDAQADTFEHRYCKVCTQGNRCGRGEIGGVVCRGKYLNCVGYTLAVSPPSLNLSIVCFPIHLILLIVATILREETENLSMARLNNEVERSHDSPMDYAWNDGRGPVDASSPFMQASQGSSSQHPGAGHKSTSMRRNIPNARPMTLNFRFI